MDRYRIVEVDADLIGGQIEVDESTSGNIETTADIGTQIRVNNVSDYNLLGNKPLINGVTLQNDKTFEDLGLQGISNIELENLLT